MVHLRFGHHARIVRVTSRAMSVSHYLLAARSEPAMLRRTVSGACKYDDINDCNIA